MASVKDKIFVKIGEMMPAEKAIKKFKRMCDSYGIIKEYRDREHFKKPSIKARLKREEAEKRRKKEKVKGRFTKKY
jgi:small subunit ribosomal protein S21